MRSASPCSSFEVVEFDGCPFRKSANEMSCDEQACQKRPCSWRYPWRFHFDQGPRVPSNVNVPRGIADNTPGPHWPCRNSPPNLKECLPIVQRSESTICPVTSVRPEGCDRANFVEAGDRDRRRSCGDDACQPESQTVVLSPDKSS